MKDDSLTPRSQPPPPAAAPAAGRQDRAAGKPGRALPHSPVPQQRLKSEPELMEPRSAMESSAEKAASKSKAPSRTPPGREPAGPLQGRRCGCPHFQGRDLHWVGLEPLNLECSHSSDNNLTTQPSPKLSWRCTNSNSVFKKQMSLNKLRNAAYCMSLLAMYTIY